MFTGGAFLVLGLILTGADGGTPRAADLYPALAKATFVIETPQGQGSGVLVADNLLATNAHVVLGSTTVKVRQGKVTWEAEVLAADEDRDVALVRVEELERVPVTLRVAPPLAVGEKVFAVGAPRGMDFTLSDGIISGLRKLDDGQDWVQTTTPISPGSSGGGLFDEHGRLVGLTTMVRLDAQNLNFAVPVAAIRELESRGPGIVRSKKARRAPKPPPDVVRCIFTKREVLAKFTGGMEVVESSVINQALWLRGLNTQILQMKAVNGSSMEFVLEDVTTENSRVFVAAKESGRRVVVHMTVSGPEVTYLQPTQLRGQPRVVAVTTECVPTLAAVIDAERAALSRAEWSETELQRYENGCDRGIVDDCRGVLAFYLLRRDADAARVASSRLCSVSSEDCPTAP
jgi:hypothetical protein